MLQIEMSLVRTQLVSLEFFIAIRSVRSRYGPGVDSASNGNEYQEYFMEGKGGRCVRLTSLPPSCAAVTKCGNLNLLEPSGPVQACNGTVYLYHNKSRSLPAAIFTKFSTLRPHYVEISYIGLHPDR